MALARPIPDIDVVLSHVMEANISNYDKIVNYGLTPHVAGHYIRILCLFPQEGVVGRCHEHGIRPSSTPTSPIDTIVNSLLKWDVRVGVAHPISMLFHGSPTETEIHGHEQEHKNQSTSHNQEDGQDGRDRELTHSG